MRMEIWQEAYLISKSAAIIEKFITLIMAKLVLLAFIIKFLPMARWQFLYWTQTANKLERLKM